MCDVFYGCGLHDAWVETKSCFQSQGNKDTALQKLNGRTSALNLIESSKALSAEFVGIVLTAFDSNPSVTGSKVAGSMQSHANDGTTAANW